MFIKITKSYEVSDAKKKKKNMHDITGFSHQNSSSNPDPVE